MRRAAELWQRGEKALTQFRLAFIGLPDADEAVAVRLSLAVKLFESGVLRGAKCFDLHDEFGLAYLIEQGDTTSLAPPPQ
jgi:hypothetical protein